jgi:hypothetical protein
MPIDLIIATNTVSEPPTPPASGTPGWPTDGTAAAGFADATVFPSYHYASILQELINVVEAAGETPSVTNNAQLLPAIQTLITAAGGTVGSARKLIMSVPAASAAATLTADEIIVETALAGLSYRLGSFNKTINLATTGAGGMDTGAAPDSGYVAIYAIFDPTTGTAALLATNATTAVAPSVYGGAHMPAGITASALVSVWPTNSSGQLVAGAQIDRQIMIGLTGALSTTSSAAPFATLSIASIVPPNAQSISGSGSATNSVAASMQLFVASTSGGAGEIEVVGCTTPGSGSYGSSFKLMIVTPQTMFYAATNSTGTATFGISIAGYSI